MMDKELLRGLEEHHRVIRVGLTLIQSHCATDCANIAGLEKARLDLTRASRERSAFVSDCIIPRLLETADSDDRAALSVNERGKQSSALLFLLPHLARPVDT